MAEQEQKRTFKTPKGRLSFPSLYEANDYSDPPRFEATLIFDEDTDLSEMVDLAVAAGKQMFPKPFANCTGLDDWPKGYNPPLRHCSEKDLDGYDHDGYFATFRNKNPVPIVDAGKNPIAEKSGEIYGGCYGHIAYSVYAYDNKTKGVAFGLSAFQKVADGETFASSVDVDAVFDDETGEVDSSPASKSYYD